MSELHPHLALLRKAIDSEERWQRQEYERSRKLPLEERVAVGLSLGPLRVMELRQGARGRTIVRLMSQRGPLHDGIGAGDPIVLGIPTTPDLGAAGTLLFAEGNVAEVIVEGDFEDMRPQVVSKRFDPTTFTRQRQALARANEHPSPLRDVLLGLKEPSPPRQNGVPMVTGALNPVQIAAAKEALSSEELALIHGPPGTGKTQVITAMLRGLVSLGDKPWALADSNAAVDHLALRAAREGLQVVRVGHPLRISDACYPLTLDAQIESGPAGALLKDLDKQLLRLKDNARERRVLFAERDAAYANARDAVFAGAQVIAVTLGTLARVAPELPKALTAIVDEATQAVEPGIWTVVPYVERLILVGDPHQLGPVVNEPGNPLETSMLSRLLREHRVPMPMLTTQYRMHAAIQELVQPVYGGQLVADASVSGHRLSDLPGVKPTDLTSRATLWVDTAGAGFAEARDEVTRSLYNDGEVRLVAIAVRELLAAGVPSASIAVIAPYSAQVERLRKVVAGVEVNTVNAYQGREKEAVIVSFVRSNDEGILGFVSDRRRLVVALSRARRLLVAIGDSITLGRDPNFTRAMDNFQTSEAWATAWEEPWSEAQT